MKIDSLLFYSNLVEVYRIVQERGEIAYREQGLTGNFSHDTYQPGIKLGEILEKFGGLYLDVRCGMLEAPAYMKRRSPPVRWLGIDPASSGTSNYYGRCNFAFL
jgi:hypothetical protein